MKLIRQELSKQAGYGQFNGNNSEVDRLLDALLVVAERTVDITASPALRTAWHDVHMVINDLRDGRRKDIDDAVANAEKEKDIEIRGLEEDVTRLEERIDELQKDASKLQDEIFLLEDEVADLKNPDPGVANPPKGGTDDWLF